MHTVLTMKRRGCRYRKRTFRRRPKGAASTALVTQSRDECAILDVVRSMDLFETGTLISVQGTGTVGHEGKEVSRVLLAPGEEVVIWFYAAKGRIYTYQCTINGHSMH